MVQDRLNSIKYTWEHKKAFLKIEKILTGKNTLRGYLHDMDKIILKIFLPKEIVHKIHTKHSRHHRLAHTRKDYIQMVIDWECSRLSKKDAQMNARETMEYECKKYPNMSSEIRRNILPILHRLGL